MECPVCKKEMKLGYIPNGNQPVQWIPEGSKPSMFSFSKAEDGVELVNKFSPMKTNGYRAEAYYCANCKVVIAPTK